jgi:hypothetical protein
MNEQNISSLLETFTGVTHDRVPAVQSRLEERILKPRRVGSPRLRFALAGVGFVLLAAGATLYPRYAEANTLRRVQEAIGDARSLVYDISIALPNGTWDHRLHVSYLDGMWRYESSYKGKATAYLLRGGRRYEYWKTLSCVISKPDSTKPAKTNLSGIELAREFSEEGDTNTPASRSTEGHADVDGRPTYAILADRPTDHLHSVVVVDKQTNLPIEADASFDLNGHTVRSHADYRFNVGLDAKLFDPDFGPGLRVINLPEDAKKVCERWTTPLRVFSVGKGSLEIRDIRANSKGEIFIVYTKTNGLKPVRLDDGLGTAYLSYGPFSSTTSDDRDSGLVPQIDGKDVDIIRFVPAAAPTKPVHKVTVSIGPDGLTPMVSFRPVPASAAKAACLVSLQEPFAGTFPDYAVVLDQNRADSDSAMVVPDMRGDYFRLVTHQYEMAVPAYREEVAVQRDMSPIHAWRTLQKIAECLRKSGHAAEASKVEAQEQEAKGLDPAAVNLR